MTGPAVEAGPDALLRATFRAMASDVTLTTGTSTPDPDATFAAVVEVFERVERECTRFDPLSDLMRANAAARKWHRVGPYCYAALRAAAAAHRTTGGRFDPRVLRALERLGYQRSLPFAEGTVVTAEPASAPTPAAAGWAPRFDDAARAVQIGPDPVDLGGIGKGLAVSWAAARAKELSPAFVLDAGGDCYVHGLAPDGLPWRVGVEDPRGGSGPLAVLAVSGAGCATSSVRLRRWQAGRQSVHHLIDPRTGQPGGAGLLSVTAIHPDAAHAEIQTKVLFLHGAEGIAAAAVGTAALWVDEDAYVHMSDAMRPYLMWQSA